MTAANPKNTSTERVQGDPNFSRPCTGSHESPLTIMSLVQMTTTDLGSRSSPSEIKALVIDSSVKKDLLDVKLSVSREIQELKNKSGLTRDRLGQIFGVSRRTLHNWAEGKAISSKNHQKLTKVLLLLENVSQGSPGLNRKLLLSVREGVVPIDLLVEDRFEDFEHLLDGVKLTAPRELSADEVRTRAPIAPALLMGTHADPVHKSIDRPRRKAKTKRVSADGSRRSK